MGLILCIVVICGLIGCSKKEENPLAGMSIEEQKQYILEKTFEQSRIETNSKSENFELEIQPDHKRTTKGDYVYVTGSVKNIGSATISYFQIICKFTDESNQILDSSYTNDNLQLEPNEMRKFEIQRKNDDNFKKYYLSIGEVK